MMTFIYLLILLITIEEITQILSKPQDVFFYLRF
jgi:hypothetical protein